MIQIRQGVFETNSSSTHSICIQKKPVDADYREITFNLGEFGWNENIVNFGDYLYTAIMCGKASDSKSNKLLKKLKAILDKHHIRYHFEKPIYDEKHSWLSNGYIDHSYNLGNFVDTVLKDEDLLLRGLFGEESAVYTGNDNTDYEDNLCDVARDYTWVKDKDGNWFKKKVGNWDNPYYDPDNYDYFYKGN